MDRDYLLIGVDPENQFALRFLSLSHSVRGILENLGIEHDQLQSYSEFLLASVLAGSHQVNQNSTLFQLAFPRSPFQWNAQVSAKGPFRANIIPLSLPSKHAQMLVTELYPSGKPKELSITSAHDQIENIFNGYLSQTREEPNLLLLHSDPEDTEKKFGVWLQKLPNTTAEMWEPFIKKYRDRSRFLESFKNTSDPDRIIGSLFDFPLRIMAVPKPYPQIN